MALKIFGKSKTEEEIGNLDAKVAALENRISSDLIKHLTIIEVKITKLSKEQADLRAMVVANSGELSRLRTVSQKNSNIIEKQVEEAIPIDISRLQNDVSDINERLGAMKVILDRMMRIMKQITDPANRINQKILKLEDQLEVLGSIDLIHLVDKLEIIKEQLQNAQENFIPAEVASSLKALDTKLHILEKRLEELEDQLIRPVEEVEVHSR